jgi:hypothetical protein
MWQHFISRQTEGSNVPVEIVGHFRRFFCKNTKFSTQVSHMKIHSKSKSLNAEILRKSHTLFAKSPLFRYTLLAIIRPKSQISNVGHDGTLSIKIFLLMFKELKNPNFEAFGGQ